MNKSKSILSVLLMFLSGCAIYHGRNEAFMSGHCYLNPQKPVSAIRKVALVEMENHTSNPQVSADFTDTFSRALTKRHLFGLEVIYRRDAVYNSLQLNETGIFRHDRLARLRETLKADAVLLGSVTQYQPYPHMGIGVHVKLIDLSDGGLVWAVQQVWDSSDKALEKRLKEFFRSQMRSGYEPMKWQLAVVSPKHFRRFVAYEIVQTLP